MASSRPARTVIPSAKLGPDNAGDMELTSHRKAIATKAAKFHQPFTPHEPLKSASPPPLVSSQSEIASQSDSHTSPSRSPTPVPKPRKRPAVVLSDDENLSDTQAVSDKDSPKPVTAKPKKKRQKANPSLGMYSHGWTLLLY
jgi:hypothetical protein